MFGEFLHLESISSSKSLDSASRAQQSSSFDLQFEICSRYMKMTSEQLYHREIELMENTTKFIQKITDSLMLKDISSTQESLTLEPFLDDEDPFTQPTKSRLLLRKCQSNSSLRRTESGVTEALREVQNKCSQRTSSMLSNMAGQFRRLKEKLANSQKEKDLKKLEAKYLVNEEQLVLAKSRITDLQIQNKAHQEQTSILKRKLKELSDYRKTTLNLSKSSDNLLILANPQSHDKLKKYLQQKEVHIFKKEREVKIIQDKIQKAIEGVIDGKSCDKCCQLVKRIKQSILKYRTYLEEESKTTQALYCKHKQLFSS